MCADEIYTRKLNRNQSRRIRMETELTETKIRTNKESKRAEQKTWRTKKKTCACYFVLCSAHAVDRMFCRAKARRWQWSTLCACRSNNTSCEQTVFVGQATHLAPFVSTSLTFVFRLYALIVTRRDLDLTRLWSRQPAWSSELFQQWTSEACVAWVCNEEIFNWSATKCCKLRGKKEYINIKTI